MSHSPAAVAVYCRIRPRVAQADGDDGRDALAFTDTNVQPIDKATSRSNSFGFDRVFNPSHDQLAVFEKIAHPMVEAFMSGINATIMAYGQTGSGKTYTMSSTSYDNPGLTPRTIEAIFRKIEEADDKMEFTLRVAMVEASL